MGFMINWPCANRHALRLIHYLALKNDEVEPGASQGKRIGGRPKWKSACTEREESYSQFSQMSWRIFMPNCTRIIFSYSSRHFFMHIRFEIVRDSVIRSEQPSQGYPDVHKEITSTWILRARSKNPVFADVLNCSSSNPSSAWQSENWRTGQLEQQT